ncbi:ADP-ribosylglycohydrolase family protein [Mycobacterium sp. MYCO198283]|uniref:ADP-ribosylglycohydrolase family protein n=1 Tax=Mycobacterium sp. MYCO198283 TaxID=2883505 RepID=UPI001E315647|nr:ADP-ribosylglycohydrolase family protein [Mycobacterium sp. MYCO198283]MCG5432151.1 ADP-ribosylglycohydrolase family protein [Mycobacterium sp. MYCO198283]
MTREDRIAGGLIGLLVGDALGVPYEFHAAAEIPAAADIDFEPPAGFRRAHAGIPPGTWSDDGAQALCLLASLLHCRRLDLDDFGRRLLAWRDDGYLAVDQHVYDVGIQTDRAMSALRSGVPAATAGPAEERANGNGSLMRVLPLALWHTGDDAALAADAMAQSRVTHGHLRSQLCCAVYCLWARRMLAGSGEDAGDEPYLDALATLRRIVSADSEASRELDTHVAPDEPRGRGSGYVVDCLRSARQCVAAGSDYESVVKAAIALGDDTDTTAAVAGGIAGIAYGRTGIPARWRDGLRGRELVDPLLADLLAPRP